METLFVYGTLCPGRSNAPILEGIGGMWQTGFVSGFTFLKDEAPLRAFPVSSWMIRLRGLMGFFSLLTT